MSTISTSRRRRSTAILIASTLALHGCVATMNTAAMGQREEDGIIRSPEDMTVVGSDLIFHGDVVETRAPGGVTFSGESKQSRVTRIERDRPWWARVDREEFMQRAWSTRSRQIHEGPVPVELRDHAGSDARRAGTPSGPPADECYSIHVTSYGVMEMTTCAGRLLGPGTSARAPLRHYRSWWAYPVLVVAYPLAVAFDTVTFPLQLFAYVEWNGERTRW